MTDQILDYSSGPPAATAVKNAGYVGASRYLSWTPNPKVLTSAECVDYWAHGLMLATVWEVGADPLGSDPVAAGREVDKQMRADGFPDGWGFFIAFDYDAQQSDWPQLAGWGDACSKAAGRPWRGYCKKALGEQLAHDGHFPSYWCPFAWSGDGLPGMHACLFQRLQQVVVDGVDCDINDVLQADWLGWMPAPATPVLWPFSVRDDGANPGQDGSGQWRHIDQGQDLQAAVNTNVIAIADGTIHYAHDPQGFGDPYPVLELDTPIDGNPAVYYGHQHPDTPDGGRVTKRQVIAVTSQTPGGNAAGLPGWLEFGWWNNGPTGDGQSMHDHLLGAVQPAPAPPPIPVTLPTGEPGMKADIKVPISGGNGHAPVPGTHATDICSVRFNGAVDAHGTPIQRAAPTWDADEVNGTAQVNVYGTIVADGGIEECTVWYTG